MQTKQFKHNKCKQRQLSLTLRQCKQGKYKKNQCKHSKCKQSKCKQRKYKPK